MSNYVRLVACRHDGNDKPYLFEAPADSYIEDGTEVLVETRRGNQRATVIGSQFAEVGSDMYNFLLEVSGAKLPLKHVLGKFTFTEYKYKEA